MKNLLIIGFLLLSCDSAFAQSKDDVKAFLRNAIHANPPLDNYVNGLFLANSITLTDANRITGKQLSQEGYDNIFISMCDVMNPFGGYAYSLFRIADIRDFSSIKLENLGDEKVITIYLNNKYYNTALLQRSRGWIRSF